MAASTLSTVAYLFKHLYATELGSDAIREHPGLAMMDKQPGFVGDQFNLPIRYGNPQGISGGFTNAQNNASSSKGVQLAVKRFKKYGIITLDGEALSAAEGNNGAFADLVTLETDNVVNEFVDSLAFDLYRTSSGVRGTRATGGLTGNVVTLTNVDDARNFKVGMTVGASPNADGSSPRVGTTTVAGLDEDAGTVTLVSAASIASFGDGDTLFRDGDPGTCMEGMETCTPLAAPTTGDSFRGIDRSVDTRRLAGVRHNDNTLTIEEVTGILGVKIAQVGQKATEGRLNPIRFWQAVRRLNAKVEYDGGGGTATYGFESFNVATPAGTVKMFSDPDFPTNRVRIFNAAKHYIKHLRDFPHIIMDDGRPDLRNATADSIEARARSMGNYCQPVPGAHGVAAI